MKKSVMVTCPKCDGEGEIECEDCGGTGKTEKRVS